MTFSRNQCESTRMNISRNPCESFSLPDLQGCFIGSVPLRPGEKNPKHRKFKLCSLFILNVFFTVLTLIQINYQCLKLNAYLVTIFLSESGHCVYIKIPLRLSPATTFRALKNYERRDVTFSYSHL